MDKFVAVLVSVIVVLLIALFATNFAKTFIEEKEETIAAPAEGGVPKEAIKETIPAKDIVTEPIQPAKEEVVEAKEEATGKNCVDSDGIIYYTSGSVAFYKSEYPDKCLSSTKIYERYCENDQIRAVMDTCANGCENGACRSEELPAKQAVCFDSDDGLNYDVYGYVEFDGNVYRDGCSWNSVRENYCKDGKLYVTSYVCASGCEFGACKKSAEETAVIEKKCADSDNGLDYYTLGNVVFNGIKYDDKCAGSISLSERYCEDDKFKTRDFKCPDYCLNGICVKTPVCRDAVKDEGEECDGYDFGGKTCLDYGYSGGSLLCRIDCKIKFDSCT